MESEVIIPVDDHYGVTTLVETINNPEKGVWAFAQCRGNRWCVVIRTPVHARENEESLSSSIEGEAEG